ncbi:hypothetical protein [Brevibacillus agri]|uniref:hypothetical protein n=1 Tax=Brevibacillus agri TaxID=51101 RepID=UPI000471DACB|nr:hypothetical protein [Brevibacillus agri]
MKKRMITLGSIIVVIILAIIAINQHTLEGNAKRELKEYLHITATVYNNGKNDADGVSLVLYLYSIQDQKMSEILRVPVDPGYPVAFADLRNNKVYFSDSVTGDEVDNLYEYNLKTKERKQLTFGKFLFNDLFIVDNKMITNVAPQFVTVTQPAIFDRTTREFTYLNPDDDDTWCFSLSYNYTTKKLLSLTASDSEMRTRKVTEVTHIRPKTLYLMDLDFGHYQPIYHTDQFEIRLTRQLDRNRILMTYDPFMGSSKPRTLKILYIDSQKVEDFDVPGIKEVKTFYPRDNTEGLFVLGRDANNQYGLFYYDMATKNLSNVFENCPLPKDHHSLVDFVYSMD